MRRSAVFRLLRALSATSGRRVPVTAHGTCSYVGVGDRRRRRNVVAGPGLAPPATGVLDSVFVQDGRGVRPRPARWGESASSGRPRCALSRSWRRSDRRAESYGSAFDPITGRFAIALEDLAVEACEFPEHVQPAHHRPGKLIVELLAQVHGTFWNRLPRRSGPGPPGVGERRVGQQVHSADRATVEDLIASARGEDRYSGRQRPVHRRELRRGGAPHRRGTEHRHAR